MSATKQAPKMEPTKFPLKVESDPDDSGTMVLCQNGLPFAWCYSLADARLVVRAVNAAKGAER